jgi:hypothetical protein
MFAFKKLRQRFPRFVANQYQPCSKPAGNGGAKCRTENYLFWKAAEVR